MKSLGTGPVTGDNIQNLSAAQKAQARANIGAGTGSHAYFTGSSTSMPAISLGGTSYITLAVTPTVAGDALAIGEKIDAVANVDLPNGVCLASVRVSALNTVRLGFTSTAVLSLTTLTVSWTVTAHR